jgi:CBS domain containing-hemolysin-like protein
MTILITVVVVTLFVSTCCSLFEAVLFSTRRATLESAKAKGVSAKLANRFIAMKRDIAEPIAAILILNTLSHTVGATLSGMFATKTLGAANVPLFSVIFTLAILFFSEIMPKTVGAVHWRRIWPFVVIPLEVMSISLRPLVYVTQKFGDLFAKGQKGATITEDEILAMVHMGAKEGEISQEEGRMMRNIIDLENKQVRQIMTPRTVVFSLDGELSVEEALHEMEGRGFTRIPVYEEDRENIIGYVMLHDLTSLKAIKDSASKLKTVVRPVTFVPESMNCLTVLLSFLRNRRQIGMVSDEFGGVAGLVTVEELLATVLGTEIVDETDRIVDMQQDARRRRSRKKEEK